jgi:hypothetical protein
MCEEPIHRSFLMNNSRRWQFACVTLVAFLGGYMISENRQAGSSRASAAETTSADAPLTVKARTVQFVDDGGAVRGELIVRNARIDGRNTLQLALVDPKGRDVWTGPSEVKIIPTR